MLEPLEERRLLSAATDITGLTAMRIDPTYNDIDGALPNGTRVGVAIVDTGLDADHPDLAANFVAYYDAFTQTEGNITAAQDPNGHGTHVAGTAASSNTQYGVATSAGIIGVRVLGADGSGGSATLLDGLEWIRQNAVKYNIQVVNMSLGYGENINMLTSAETNTNLNRAIDRLEALGITVVSAAGNSFGNYITPGGATPGVVSSIIVGSTWAEPFYGQFLGGSPSDTFVSLDTLTVADQLSAFSQRTTLPNQLFAPGSNILSTWTGGGEKFDSGTSMASPFVAGAVALLQDAAQTFGGRYLSVTEVVDTLKTTADTVFDGPVSTPNNGRVAIANLADGVLSPSEITNLPETNQTYLRINVQRAVESVRQMFLGAGGTNTVDVNARVANATSLPFLNGTRDFATVGNVGLDGAVQVGSDDIDLYRVVITSIGDLRINVDPVAHGVDFDALLRVFDVSGTEIAFSDDGNSNNPSYPVAQAIRLNPGTYYIGITSYNNSNYNIVSGAGAVSGNTQGDYWLTVGLTNPDPNGVIAGAVGHSGLPGFFLGTIGSDPAPLDSVERIDIGGEDVDIFEFIAPDSGTLTAEVDSVTVVGNGAPFDTYVRIFDESGNQLVFDDDSGFSSDSLVQLGVTAGQRVFVAVSSYSGRSYNPLDAFGRTTFASSVGGNYQLHLTLNNSDQDGTVATANIGTDVNTSAIGTDGGAPVGLTGALDVDFYRFTPTADELIRVDMVNSGGTAAMTLWMRPVGSPFADPVRIAEATAGSALIFEVSNGVDYWISISGAGNSTYKVDATASGSQGQLVGSYIFQSQHFALNLFQFVSDGQIGNNAVSNIGLGGRLIGQIGLDFNAQSVIGDTDVDLYRFVAPSTGQIRIETLTYAEGSADTFLRFFNSAGTELARNDNISRAQLGSLLSVSVTAGQTYYIGVNGASANAGNYNPLTGAGAASGSTGSYILAVDAANPVPTNLAEAAAGFSRSVEAYSNFVKGAYRQYLLREAEPAGLNNWVANMQAGLREESIEAFFIGSPEFIAKNGGRGEGWIRGMYQRLLGRTPGQSEVNGWLQALANGTSERDIAFGFAASRERQTQRIQENYRKYLGRSAFPSEIGGWVNFFLAGGSNSEIIAGFVGSPEYFLKKGNANKRDWTIWAYLQVLGRTPSQGEINTWVANLT